MPRKKRRFAKKRRLHVKRRTPPGATPGTVKPDPSAHPSEVELISFDASGCETHSIESLDQLEGLSEEQVHWVNVNGVGSADTIQQLGKRFGLHPLALEDVVNVGQRPKMEDYLDHLFIVARQTTFNDSLEMEQTAIFLCGRTVLTFQERPGDCFEPVRKRIRANRGRIRAKGVDYLAYALIDAIVDSHFPVVEQFGHIIDKLDEQVSSRTSQSVLADIQDLRGDLLVLRRVALQHRDLIATLIREPSKLIQDETRIYLRDCHDHTIQVGDLLETYREMASSLRDYYLSAVSNRTNEVMQVLTIIATIFIPMSFVAGVYGMNFNPEVSPWNMPELNWAFGYPFALGLMGLIAVAMLFYFAWKGWLRP